MSGSNPAQRLSKSSRTSSSAKGSDKMMSWNIRKLQSAINNLLNAREKDRFEQALNIYYTKRNVQELVQTLDVFLDTPAKRQIYSILGHVMPSSDQNRYWNFVDSLLSRARQLQIVSEDSLLSTTNQLREEEKEKVPEPEPTTWIPATNHDLRKVTIRMVSEGAVGFSIRGGSEHGIGIFVSSLDSSKIAQLGGLKLGDQILQINGISFEKITHRNAVKVIKGAETLSMTVKSAGRIPGSHQTHQTYTWVDVHGRSVSPPPDHDSSNSDGRKSNLHLLRSKKERKVHLVVTENQSLGLKIRGGKEFGLGIYITGVDSGSVADDSGLKAGFQILDINRVNFLDIEHQGAVNILKSSKMMIMRVKDVGKLPYTRTVYDKTQWIMGNELSQLSDNKSDSSRKSNGSSGSGRSSVSSSRLNWSGGSSPQAPPGGGMPRSDSITSAQSRSTVDEQAKQLLSDNERGTMQYYLREYQNQHISAHALVLALFDLLNTHAKFSLFSEVRSCIFPKDIDCFDTLVLKREVETMKMRRLSDILSDNGSDYLSMGDTVSNSSRYSSSSVDSRPLTPPRVPTELPPHMKLTDSGIDNWEQLLNSPYLNDDTEGLPDYILPDFTESPPELTSRLTPTKTLPLPGQTLRLPTMTTNAIGTHTSPSATNSHREAGPAPSQLTGSLHASQNSATESMQLYAALHDSSTSVAAPAPLLNGVKEKHSTSQEITVDTSWNGSKGNNSSANESSPGSDCPKKDGCELERRHSFDSVTTEGSVHSIPEATTLSLATKRNMRISDPTHHVPREQQTRVARTKKASQTLYELKKQTSPDSAKTFKTPPQSDKADVGQPIAKQQTSLNGSKPSSPRFSSKLKDNHKPIAQTPKPPESIQGTLNRANASGSFIPLENTEVIVIKKKKPTLGIAIQGGVGTSEPLPKVVEIQHNGSAYHSSNLKRGHVILKVNNHSVVGMIHREIAKVIAQAFKDKTSDLIELLVIDSNKYRI